MCYSLLCSWQDHMGDCPIGNFDKFQKTYGWPACIMGAAFQCPEDEQYYNEVRHNLVFQYMDRLALMNSGRTYGRLETIKTHKKKVEPVEEDDEDWLRSL